MKQRFGISFWHYVRMALIMVAMIVASTASVFAQITGDLVDRVDRAVGVSLPSEYKGKMKEFVKNSKILKDEDANAFTEQFIKGQMKTSWGINRQNQYLFVWDAVYEQITKKNIYTGEDNNKNRLNEFEKVMDKVEACGKKYNTDFKAYMRKLSAEAEQRSAISLHHILVQMIEFYKLRNSAYENEIKWMKEQTADEIKDCDKYNINYHSLLPLEVQRFYNIKPTSQQNTLTCERAIVQLLNITLDEIVKLYNLYQQTPNAKREKRDIKSIIEDCKKYNVDYKSKLSPEVRKFYGVE